MKEEEWEVFDSVRQMIEKAEHIVCVTGLDMIIESGGRDLWCRDEFYRIERQYGKSPEEMLSAGVYNAKKERFFQFYKAEILSDELKPSATYQALKKMQDYGKLKTVISMNINGLEYRSGLRNVVELSGSIFTNYCPICKQYFPLEYMKNARSVPICEKCEVAIRPGVRLFGENVRNDLMTEAALACASADLILVLGINLFGSKVQYCTGHYKGNKLILIREEEHFTDRYADFVLHERPCDVLPELIAGIRSKKEEI